MHLKDPVTTIPGVGSIVAGKLANLDIYTIFDLLYHIPSRYEDRTQITPAAQVRVGDTVTIVGSLSPVRNVFTKNGKRVQTATLTDHSGKLSVIWFNQMYLSRTFAKDTLVTLYGKVDFFNHKPCLISPQFELGQSTGIIPIYPETAGLTSKFLRSKIQHLLSTVPDEIIPNAHLMSWKTALTSLHFPTNLDQVGPAKHRLAFDELFLLGLSGLKRRQDWQSTKLDSPFNFSQGLVQEFVSSLAFTLTPSQTQATSEIIADLRAPHPMNRLLQGDVGTGKTVVAATAAFATFLSGFKTILLAPTQILAHQHHTTLSALFKPFNIEVGLITAASKLPHANCKIVVGTHALLTTNLTINNIGLVIVDEQHRFGVKQRQLARDKGASPHVLTMTATPIPRTIALTLFGDLDVSVLTDGPRDRIRIKTWVVPETKRAAAYTWIKSQIIDTKSQAFIVCPLIEDSETLTAIKSVTTQFHKLQKVFSPLKLGLLHGRLKPTDKDQVLHKFREGKLDILVTTPVVEVGIDIPNATIMLIESADRFGLAQLHQLRGRVGRSAKESYCLLFADTDSSRLQALEKHHSGLELAEIDLRLRGVGDIYGTAQHGQKLNLKIATFTDLDQIQAAKALAEKLLPTLDTLPFLPELLQQAKIDAT